MSASEWDKSFEKRDPWVVVDPEFMREWVLPTPIRYYIVHDPAEDIWFVCDRWSDLMVPETESPTRDETIRRFYKSCGREMPENVPVPYPTPGISHRGETG
jgi:hypothetical protein